MEGGSFVVEVHIVQKGDTLWKISRQYGISFEELKRVNAHLANPDYIVPGMKIFLPNQVQGKQETPKKQTEPVKKVEKVENLPVVEKKPVKEPELPKEKHPAPKQEKEPIPVPKPPKITTKPVEKEKVEQPKKQKPPAEKPKVEQPKPPQHNEQMHHPTQPMIPVQPYPVFGIPCGWMPIYDADCYGHHYHQHYHQHRQPAPMHEVPTRPMPQLPVEESTHHKPYRPPTQPTYPEKKKQKSKDHEKVRPLTPQLTEPSLTVPNHIPNIESPTIKQPMPEPKRKEEVKPPVYEHQVQPPPAQPTPYPNWSYPQAPRYPVHAGETPFHEGNQFTQMPVMPSVPPMQPHPFCTQCHQPVHQHSRPPMYFPAPYHWQGPHS